MNRKIDKVLLDRFSAVFEQQLWGYNESVSGPGSRRDNPMVISALSALDAVITEFDIKSLADIPCGDFNFLEPILQNFPDLRYVGYDIVQQLIERNKAKYPRFNFEWFDIVSDVAPRFDLVFTKELLIHLPDSQVVAALSNIQKSGSKFLLASNSFGVKNEDLIHDSLGYARPIDLLAAPYNFPEPLWRNAFYALWNVHNVEIPDSSDSK